MCGHEAARVHHPYWWRGRMAAHPSARNGEWSTRLTYNGEVWKMLFAGVQVATADPRQELR